MTGGRLLDAGISEKNVKKITDFQAQIGEWAFIRAWAFIRILIFIGLEPPSAQSIDCDIHWLAHAFQCIFISKIRYQL